MIMIVCPACHSSRTARISLAGGGIGDCRWVHRENQCSSFTMHGQMATRCIWPPDSSVVCDRGGRPIRRASAPLWPAYAVSREPVHGHERQFDIFWSADEYGIQKLEVLEHEANARCESPRACSAKALDHVPARKCDPSDGHRAARIFISVDLPEPEGPTRARNSPVRHRD